MMKEEKNRNSDENVKKGLEGQIVEKRESQIVDVAEVQTAEDYEDDGRVIADMSELELQPLLIPKTKFLKRGSYNTAKHGNSQVQLSRDEKRALMGGALSAALVLLLAFAIGFGLIIWLIGLPG